MHAVTSKIFSHCGRSDTLQLLDGEAIDRAVAVLRQARRIAVYGFGNSATVCRDLTTRYLGVRSGYSGLCGLSYAGYVGSSF